MLRSSLITPQLDSHKTRLHHDRIFSGHGNAGGTCDAVSYQTLVGKDPPRFFTILKNAYWFMRSTKGVISKLYHTSCDLPDPSCYRSWAYLRSV